jgi:hypothetical protein
MNSGIAQLSDPIKLEIENENISAPQCLDTPTR